MGETMNTPITTLTGLELLCALAGVTAAASAGGTDARIERGRYLAVTSGCNDCHTPGYLQGDGNVPVDQWLTGNPVGFQGPWGTTYPANLRLSLSQMTEQQWLAKARSAMRPPMPWFNLREMSDDDLLALYAFVRSLKPVGTPAPAYAPPGQAVNTPYFDFTPKNLPMTAKVGK
jgi:mono/diheme cytochrome c family protein